MIAARRRTEGADFETILATLQERVFANARRAAPGLHRVRAELSDVSRGPRRLAHHRLQLLRRRVAVRRGRARWSGRARVAARWIGMPAGAADCSPAAGRARISLRWSPRATRPRVRHREARRSTCRTSRTRAWSARRGWPASRGNVRTAAVRSLSPRCEGPAAIAADRAAGHPADGGRERRHHEHGRGGSRWTRSPISRARADLDARGRRVWRIRAHAGGAELAGLGRADSVTMDPHKWLYVPFECGCLLAKDPRAQGRVPDPARLSEGRATSGGEVKFADYGEQLSRWRAGSRSG